MSEVFLNFAQDLGVLLREKARDARRASDDAEGTPEEQFQSGRLIGYYEALSLMTQQAAAFGLSPDKAGGGGRGGEGDSLR
jgi:hypothetical protein